MLQIGKEAVIEMAGKSGSLMVRGWKGGDHGYILAEKPRGPFPPVNNGQGAVIRMEHNGMVVGVAVTYQEYLKKTDLCYFSFNDEVMMQSLRNQERFPCILPVTLRRAANQLQALGHGMIVDISRGGVRVISRTPFDISEGDTVAGSFFPGGLGLIDRQKIRIMRATCRNGHYEYAGQFLDMEAANEKLLLSYFEFCRTWAA